MYKRLRQTLTSFKQMELIQVYVLYVGRNELCGVEFDYCFTAGKQEYKQQYKIILSHRIKRIRGIKINIQYKIKMYGSDSSVNYYESPRPVQVLLASAAPWCKSNDTQPPVPMADKRTRIDALLLGCQQHQSLSRKKKKRDK